MSRRVLSTANLTVGAALMFLGAILVGPSLLVGLRYRVAPAVLLEAFAEPLDDGRVRLAVLYEYEIAAGDLEGVHTPARALAWARCDRFGRPLDDLVVSDAEAIDFITRVRSDQPVQTRAYYDPSAPLTSAQAHFATTGTSLWWSLPHLGLLLLLAPPLTWVVLILLRSTWRTPRRV